jgi:hypothetical protein
VDVSGIELESEGIIYSSKRLLMNIKKQRDSLESNEIAYSSDATFGLMHIDWALYSVGCTTLIRYDSESVRSSYRPFMFLLSRTERGDGYSTMFRILMTSVLQWLDIDRTTYKVQVVCMDHHEGLINAATMQLGIGIKTCSLTMCLYSIIIALAALMLHKWRTDNENELANWFEATYLTEPYNHWSVTCSGIPGVMPNQNPIESFHREQKRDYFGQYGNIC